MWPGNMPMYVYIWHTFLLQIEWLIQGSKFGHSARWPYLFATSTTNIYLFTYRKKEKDRSRKRGGRDPCVLCSAMMLAAKDLKVGLRRPGLLECRQTLRDREEEKGSEKKEMREGNRDARDAAMHARRIPIISSLFKVCALCVWHVQLTCIFYDSPRNPQNKIL